MPASLVCSGASLSGLLLTNGRRLITGVVKAANLAPLSGALLATLTNGSASITFSATQTLPAGFQLTFDDQPGVVYTLAAPVVAATAATLTTPFTGTPGVKIAAGIASATFHVAGPNFTFDAVQTLPVGYQFQVDGTGTIYTLTTPVAASTALPTSSFTPALSPAPTDGTRHTITPAVSFAGTTALCIQGAAATDGSPVAVLRVAQANGEATQLQATPWATLLASSIATVLTCPGGTFEA